MNDAKAAPPPPPPPPPPPLAPLQTVTVWSNVLPRAAASPSQKNVDTSRNLFHNEGDPTAQLHDAVEKGSSIELIGQLLEKKADPNASIQHKMGKTKPADGTVFTLAVMTGRKDVVLRLANAHADVNSMYSFEAGSERLRWTGPAICATISKKSMAMMRCLVDLHADIDGPVWKYDDDKPTGTLIYMASYIGYAPCVRFLLERNTNNEKNMRVMFQDDKTKYHSPLSIAVHRGHLEVVRLLLDGRADMDMDLIDPRFRGRPKLVEHLIDAIHMHFLEIVKQLVTASADIFTVEESTGARALDYILRSENSNSAIMAAVAQGLKQSSNEVELRQLRIEDVERFLWTNNPHEILDVVFRPRVLQTWVAEPGTAEKAMRKEWRTACMPRSKIQLNVVAGRDIEYFRKRFEEMMTKGINSESLRRCSSRNGQTISRVLQDLNGEADEHFLHSLTMCYSNRRMDSAGNNGQVPAEFCQCLVSHLHSNVKVILAIAKASNLSVFDHPGAQAIVMNGWIQHGTLYRNTFFYNVALAICFFMMSIILQAEEADSLVVWKWLTLIIIMILWSRNIFYEIMQMIGLVILGQGRMYFSTLDNYVDFLRILATATSIIIMANSHHWNIKGSVGLRTVLAYTMWVRWIKVLYTARGFEMSGQHMLAIMYAVQSVWPFLSVVIWPLFGFINCYYMLGLYDLWRSAVIIYRMAFVGDFDLEEVEDVAPTLEAQGDALGAGYFQENDPELTEYNEVIGCFMVLVTLLFTIVLMNIFIGVLSESYANCFEKREQLFLHTRSNIILEHEAINKALHAFKARVCCPSSKTAPDADNEPKRAMVFDASQEYLWFCRPKEADEFGLSCEQKDHGSAANTTDDRLESMRVEIERHTSTTNERLESMRMGIESLTEQMSAFMSQQRAVDTKN